MMTYLAELARRTCFVVRGGGVVNIENPDYNFTNFS